MLARIDQPVAAWRLMAAESKGFARVTAIAAAEAGMRAHGIEPLPTL
jgi:hypothetical protein